MWVWSMVEVWGFLYYRIKVLENVIFFCVNISYILDFWGFWLWKDVSVYSYFWDRI